MLFKATLKAANGHIVDVVSAWTKESLLREMCNRWPRDKIYNGDKIKFEATDFKNRASKEFVVEWTN